MSSGSPADGLPSSKSAPAAGGTGSPVALCIVGMHRSGTSSLTGSLQRAGLHIGDVVTSAPFNAKGNRESVLVQRLNDDVLAFSGGSWDRPPERLRWSHPHEIRRDAFLARLRAASRWGFKDPRTLLTLPFWRGGAPELQLVGTFRHPVAVARSLAARGRMSIERATALGLWLAYNDKLMQLWQAAPFPLISFDLSPTEYLRRLRVIVERCGLRSPNDEAEGHFFEPSLRHQLPDDGEPIPAPVEALYGELCRAHALPQRFAVARRPTPDAGGVRQECEIGLR